MPQVDRLDTLTELISTIKTIHDGDGNLDQLRTMKEHFGIFSDNEFSWVKPLEIEIKRYEARIIKEFYNHFMRHYKIENYKNRIFKLVLGIILVIMVAAGTCNQFLLNLA
jgi:hypothetical protein